MLRSVARILGISGAAVILTWLTAMAVLRQPVLSGKPLVESERADARTLEHHVRFLTNLPNGRCGGNPESLDEAARYVAASFQSSGGRVSEQLFFAGGKTFRNVIATFGPESGATLIVGAHYDAFCEPAALPGADDNASGVAGLLELARLLGTNRQTSRVDLVAYANEEPPFFGSDLMGSWIHAESLRGREVTGMLSLEMIGYFRGNQAWDSWVLRSLYSNDGEFIGVVGRWRDAPLTRRVKRGMLGGGARTVSFSWPSPTGIDASDHRSYWAHGIPAVMITDTAYLRNPNYHTAGDTADTLDYRRMAEVIGGIHNAVLYINGW